MAKPKWKDAPEWANYLAKHHYGEWYWCEFKPTYYSHYINPFCVHYRKHFLLVTTGQCIKSGVFSKKPSKRHIEKRPERNRRDFDFAVKNNQELVIYIPESANIIDATVKFSNFNDGASTLVKSCTFHIPLHRDK